MPAQLVKNPRNWSPLLNQSRFGRIHCGHWQLALGFLCHWKVGGYSRIPSWGFLKKNGTPKSYGFEKCVPYKNGHFRRSCNMRNICMGVSKKLGLAHAIQDHCGNAGDQSLLVGGLNPSEKY